MPISTDALDISAVKTATLPTEGRLRLQYVDGYPTLVYPGSEGFRVGFAHDWYSFWRDWALTKLSILRRPPMFIECFKSAFDWTNGLGSAIGDDRGITLGQVTGFNSYQVHGLGTANSGYVRSIKRAPFAVVTRNAILAHGATVKHAVCTLAAPNQQASISVGALGSSFGGSDTAYTIWADASGVTQGNNVITTTTIPIGLKVDLAMVSDGTFVRAWFADIRRGILPTALPIGEFDDYNGIPDIPGQPIGWNQTSGGGTETCIQEAILCMTELGT